MQNKIMNQIEDLSLEFLQKKLNDKKVTTQLKKSILHTINRKLLIFHKINPSSKMEQLLVLNQNLQPVLGKRLNFPKISSDNFQKNKSFYLSKE